MSDVATIPSILGSKYVNRICVENTSDCRYIWGNTKTMGCANLYIKHSLRHASLKSSRKKRVHITVWCSVEESNELDSLTQKGSISSGGYFILIEDKEFENLCSKTQEILDVIFEYMDKRYEKYVVAEKSNRVIIDSIIGDCSKGFVWTGYEYRHRFTTNAVKSSRPCRIIVKDGNICIISPYQIHSIPFQRVFDNMHNIYAFVVGLADPDLIEKFRPTVETIVKHTEKRVIQNVRNKVETLTNTLNFLEDNRTEND